MPLIWLKTGDLNIKSQLLIYKEKIAISDDF
jgi:hypothetical protein